MTKLLHCALLFDNAESERGIQKGECRNKLVGLVFVIVAFAYKLLNYSTLFKSSTSFPCLSF